MPVRSLLAPRLGRSGQGVRPTCVDACPAACLEREVLLDDSNYGLPWGATFLLCFQNKIWRILESSWSKKNYLDPGNREHRQIVRNQNSRAGARRWIKIINGIVRKV